MSDNDHQLIDYAERRQTVRRTLKVALTTLVIIAASWLALRAFLHFTGIGAHTTINASPQGFSTTRTPTPILP